MRSKETNKPCWTLVLLAGGTGSRMKARENKLFLRVGGMPVLIHSLKRMLPHADHTVIVYHPGELERIQEMILNWHVPTDHISFQPGGETRQDSAYAGLKSVPLGTTYVMVHDCARCFTPDDLIQRVKEQTEEFGAAIPAMPVTDTIKHVDHHQMIRTVDRAQLAAVQTPQGFRLDQLLTAHDAARQTGYQGTDDASLLEHAGIPCTVVPGSSSNIKLTTQEDRMMAESLYTQHMIQRVGFGFDVHRLTEGRDLILCGCTIPHSLGLLGHSDADVATHALMDAMLGAMAMGDIGSHFPDTDDQYKGADSIALLRHVKTFLDKSGGLFINGDITIAAQKPKLAPYIPAMREHLATALSVPLSSINIKATTTERLGFEGREEGISAQAVCMIRMPGI